MIRNWINGSIATCAFELKRSFTFQRNAVTAVLALFPPLMITILILAPKALDEPGIPYVEVVLIVLVALVCMLSLLLWATPNVYSELEGKSWTFISSRPGGRVSNFMGKFVAAVLSSFAVSFIAITLSVAIISQISTVEVKQPLRLWATLSGIFFIASCAYGAVFSMIGTVTYRRAMVVGVAYVMAWEGAVANLPALINRLTIRYHLQSLAMEWLAWVFPVDRQGYTLYYGDIKVGMHLAFIALITIASLCFGCYVIVNRQYITNDES